MLRLVPNHLSTSWKNDVIYSAKYIRIGVYKHTEIVYFAQKNALFRPQSLIRKQILTYLRLFRYFDLFTGVGHGNK